MARKVRAKKPTSTATSKKLEPTPEAGEPSAPIFGSNEQGFLSLPVELFDMILSDFRTFTRVEILENPPSLPEKCNERNNVLRALSQTCRSLRAACLPLAWEHVEAATSNQGRAFYKQVSGKLEKRSKGLANTPELAKYVRVMTVALTRCNIDTVLPAFADCLGKLPNLHTLQFVHVHSQMTTALKDTFGGHVYPQIRTIILPDCAHNILRSCPGVTHVTCNEHDGSKLISAIATVCKSVEAVMNIEPKEVIIKRLAKGAPQLRTIEVRRIKPTTWSLILSGQQRKPYEFPEMTQVQNLSLLKNLTSISVVVVANTSDRITDTHIGDFETQASKILKENKATGEKCVKIAQYHDRQYYDKTRDPPPSWKLIFSKTALLN